MQKEEARSVYLKAKLYRLFAVIFAFLGLAIFAVVYFRFSGGNFLKAITDPFLIAIIIFPFAPALILSHLAVKSEKKLNKYFVQPEEKS